MSQITRCPSCSTSFKVVADQLRISEGWVRCGQCKEVFDASAHLLPAPPPALLPDVSLTDVRPPPAPVVRRSDAGRAWGAPAESTAQRPAAKPVAAPAAPLYAAEDFSLFAPEPAAPVQPDAAMPPSVPPAQYVAPDTAASLGTHEVSSAPAGAPASEPVLAVPDPAVPAFLAAGGEAGRGADTDLQLEPLTPFAWRARDSLQSRKALAPGADGGAAPHPLDAVASARSAAGPSTLPPTVDEPEGVLHAERGAAPLSPWADPMAPTAAPAPVPAQTPGAAGQGALPPVPAGYELPFADLRDDDESPLDIPPFEATLPTGLAPMEFPALELPIRPVAAPPDAAPATAREGGAQEDAAFGPEPDDVPEAASGASPASSATVAALAREPAVEALPSVEFVVGPPDTPVPAGPAALALVEDDSPAAVLQAKPRKARRTGAADEAPRPETSAAPSDEEQEEVSFVVAARRKAFWRKPAVRAALAVVLLVATLALALQVAVQERDRIAAMDARARPWLMTLCAPLQCEIAPLRQIADVVIDSSSFNKARGDSYQLTLALKSQAAMALAMPAVELTLTDAQDQPVLRRVLLPADLGAPAELPARGEWSTAVSVVVTTGGARVAGYRVLAFYP